MSVYGISTITQEVVSSLTDNFVQLKGSCFARGVLLPGGWSKVRVGMRFLFTDFSATNASQITAPNILAIGLCHGQTNRFGNLNTDNFVGVVTDGNIVYEGPAEVLIDFITLKAATKVGTTLTLSAAINAGTCQYGQGTAPPWVATPQLLFADITKGSPNFTVNAWFCQNGQVAGVISAATFLSDVAAAVPTTPSHLFGTNRTVAVDEGANGAFDSVTVSWNRSDMLVEITDLACVVLA